MKNYVIGLGFMMIAHTVCMQQIPVLPLDVVFSNICVHRDEECKKYRMTKFGGNEYLAFSWTIAPILLKSCTHLTPVEEDLSNPPGW